MDIFGPVWENHTERLRENWNKTVAPDDTVVPMLRKLDNVDYATFIELPGSASSLSPGVSAKEIFDDGE